MTHGAAHLKRIIDIFFVTLFGVPTIIYLYVIIFGELYLENEIITRLYAVQVVAVALHALTCVLYVKRCYVSAVVGLFLTSTSIFIDRYQFYKDRVFNFNLYLNNSGLNLEFYFTDNIKLMTNYIKPELSFNAIGFDIFGGLLIVLIIVYSNKLTLQK